jgi:hypothetical protein
MIVHEDSVAITVFAWLAKRPARLVYDQAKSFAELFILFTQAP